MLLETEYRPVSTAGVLATARATIKATPKIFNFFADMTYANKPVAICRELVANAQDAHTAAGKATTPVEVWLPTTEDPVFKVRDRGVGMSHEFMMTRFMAYTDGSTKSDSNDQIGGFGIGSKAPFAYTDQFTLRVAHDGTLGVYSVFKDQDGIPSIALLAQSQTDEGNGVEVSFPVAPEDFGTFEDAAFTSLCYFDPLPIVYNATDGAFSPPNYEIRGEGWALREKPGDLGVIMGGIRYPVAEHNLPSGLRYSEDLRHLLGYGIDLMLPIGACSVALSREQLSYDDRTSVAIKTALQSNLEAITEKCATMFDDERSKWAAAVRLAKLTGAYPGGYSNARAAFLRKTARYHGAELKLTIQANLHSYWEISSKRRKPRQTQCPQPSWEFNTVYLQPGYVEALIVDDLPQEPKSRTIARIRHWVNQQPRDGHIYVLRAADGDTSALLSALGFPDVIYSSSLALPPPAPRARYARPKVRMFAYRPNAARFNTLAPREYSSPTREIAYADQPEAGILVTMDSWTLPPQFWNKIDTGLIRLDELRFVNRSDAAKLKGWQDFEKVFDDRLKATLAEHPDLPQKQAVAGDRHLYELFNFCRNYRNQIELSSTQQRAPFGRIVALFDKYLTTFDERERRLAPFVVAKAPPRTNTKQIAEGFHDRQWRASRFLELTNFRLRDSKDLEIFKGLL